MATKNDQNSACSIRSFNYTTAAIILTLMTVPYRHSYIKVKVGSIIASINCPATSAHKICPCLKNEDQNESEFNINHMPRQADSIEKRLYCRKR